jgi:hypothetical protein
VVKNIKKMKEKKKTHEQCCIVLYSIKQGHWFQRIEAMETCSGPLGERLKMGFRALSVVYVFFNLE